MWDFAINAMHFRYPKFGKLVYILLYIHTYLCNFYTCVFKSFEVPTPVHVCNCVCCIYKATLEKDVPAPVNRGKQRLQVLCWCVSLWMTPWGIEPARYQGRKVRTRPATGGLRLVTRQGQRVTVGSYLEPFTRTIHIQTYTYTYTHLHTHAHTHMHTHTSGYVDGADLISNASNATYSK